MIFTSVLYNIAAQIQSITYIKEMYKFYLTTDYGGSKFRCLMAIFDNFS